MALFTADRADRATLLNPIPDDVEEYDWDDRVLVDQNRQRVGIPVDEMVSWPPAFVVCSIDGEVVVDGEVLRAEEKVVSCRGRYVVLEVHNDV